MMFVQIKMIKIINKQNSDQYYYLRALSAKFIIALLEKNTDVLFYFAPVD